jgi:serine/threonine-protein kinase RsbW
MAHPGPSPSHRAPFERTWVLREQRDSVESLQADVGRALHDFGYGEACTFAVRLALEEALINGFRHGNKGDATKSVTVRCHVDAGLMQLEVQDEGEGFNPETVPDPTAEENIEIPSGRGIMLMRAYMTSVEYVPPGNCLRITYRRAEDPRA